MTAIMIINIRTKNYDAMEKFYRDQLRLNRLVGAPRRGISFMDFDVEIHVDEVSRDEDVGVMGSLILYTRDVRIVAAGLPKRGIPVELRDRQSAVEALFKDPDGHLWMIVAREKKDVFSVEK